MKTKDIPILNIDALISELHKEAEFLTRGTPVSTATTFILTKAADVLERQQAVMEAAEKWRSWIARIPYGLSEPEKELRAALDTPTEGKKP